MKNLYNMTGQGGQYGGMGQDNRQMNGGQNRPYQGSRGYQGGQGGRQGGKQFNNRGGPRNNMRQGGNYRDNMQPQGQAMNPAAMQQMTPEQMAAMQ